jgi:hypothetical protein
VILLASDGLQAFMATPILRTLGKGADAVRLDTNALANNVVGKEVIRNTNGLVAEAMPESRLGSPRP